MPRKTTTRTNKTTPPEMAEQETMAAPPVTPAQSPVSEPPVQNPARAQNPVGPVTVEPPVQNRIYMVRNQKVMMDFDAAELYEVDVRDLIRNVRRNITRFPVDFMFKLTPEEFEELKEKSHNDRNFQRALSTPYAFTQEGVAMLAQVLKSARAMQVNLTIIRDFVKLRQTCGNTLNMANRLEELEKKYDRHFAMVFQALKKLEDAVPPPPERRIGFQIG